MSRMVRYPLYLILRSLRTTLTICFLLVSESTTFNDAVQFHLQHRHRASCMSLMRANSISSTCSGSSATPGPSPSPDSTSAPMSRSDSSLGESLSSYFGGSGLLNYSPTVANPAPAVAAEDLNCVQDSMETTPLLRLERSSDTKNA